MSFAFKIPTYETSISKGQFTDRTWYKFFQDLYQYLTTAPISVPSYTVATLPSAATYAQTIVYVSNESGGAVLAFSDGTNWRRATDRAIVS